MALYQIKAPDGNTYRIEGPDGATQDDVIRAVVAQHPYAGFTTEELKKQPSAPMSIGDIGRAGLSSLVGATGSIASAFGAESAPARGLRGLAQEIQQGMTPERQEEMRRREEIMSRAEKEGTLSEVGSGVGAVTEAPLQAVASGLGSSVPAIVAGVGAIVAGAPFAIAGAVALTAKLAVGALQGAGEAKGSIFESVTQKLMEEKGLSRTEAEAQAIKAQEYLGKNAPGIMGSAAAGMLDAVLGGPEAMVGKGFKKAATRPLTQPSYIKTGLKEAFEEAVPEAIQAGVGQVAENVALQNAGIDTSTFQGVSGAVARDALMGALTGGAVSPLQMSSLRKEYAQEKERRLNEEQAKIDEEVRREEEALRQQQEAVAAQERAKEEEMVAAPPVEVKAPKNVHPIRNPLGNIEKEDLQQEGIDPYLSQHIDEYRKSAGLPPIKSYSIEDIVDSMPGVNPVEEQKQIDTLLAARTGYSGERLTAKDVLDQAEAKQIPIDQSFSDFLTRTTGQADPKSMSQAQLFAAFKSIQALPEKAELETGSNAIRFTDKQYNAAIKSLDKKLGEEPVPVSEALSDIKLSTGLSEDMYAKSILDEAVRRGDVDRAGEKITAPTTAEVLPKGYKIQEGMFERGEKPEGFQIQMGDMVLPEVYDSQEEATRRSQEYVKGQGNLVRNINNAIKQNESTLQKAEDKLSEMQLAGKTGIEYDKAQATVSKLRVKVAENIDRLNKQLEKVDPEKAPISVIQAKARKVKGKGFTLFKDNKSVNVFKTREEAERAIVEGLPEEEIQALTQAKGRRTLKKRAEEEVTRRTQPKAPEAKPEPKPEFEPTLRALLDRFGLKDVALKIEKDMKADGEYSKAVIKVALDSANPVRTLRHESIHALKELGFFTPQQWKALENAAKTKWIDTYLKGRNINGEPLEAGQQSRYDAYMNVYKGDQDAIIEEAIADAFGDFDMTKAPPGLMTAILKRLKLFFEALRNSLTGAGFQTYEDVFGKVERGALKPAKPEQIMVKPSEPKYDQTDAWQATPKERQEALEMYDEDGFLPYVSQGRLNIPIDDVKYSLQKFNPEKHLDFDSTLGVPINKDGTVTMYYHTTKAESLAINTSKVIPANGRSRIYLTNESSGAKVIPNKGNMEQEIDGSTVLVYVTPEMLQVDTKYEDGRVDLYIPVAQGEYFNKKMKQHSIQKARTEAIATEFSYEDHEKRITDSIKKYQAASQKERAAMLKQARGVLKREHNIGSLLTENGKLEKTRMGDYNLSYDGLPVASQGLGLASAQKITDKISTCPRSSICEGLCLGETSGGNFMFGGAAAEDVGDIQKSAFRAGARMIQYLKTEALIVNPEAFAVLLQAEIDSLKRWSASPTVRKKNPETGKVGMVPKDIYAPAVRLNVTSDFKPSMFRGVIEGNKDVMFYDYTKINSDTIAPNHHITYSSTGFGQNVDGKPVYFTNKAGKYDHNWSTVKDRLNNGFNVAMAFSSKSALPKFLTDEKTGQTYRILDGDLYDARYLDQYSKEKEESGDLGVIVGLRNKAGNLSEKNATEKTQGFFVKYDPKTDGDTVVVPDQDQFKQIGPREIPIKKLSIREAPSFDMSDLPPPSEGKFVLKEGTRIYHGAHRARAEEIKAAGQKLLARPPYKSGGGMMDEGNLIWFGGKDLAEGHSKSEIDTLRAKYDEEKGLLRMEGDVFSALTDKDYSLVNRGKILTKEEANTLNNALQLPDYKKVKAGDALWQAAQRAHDLSPVVDKWQVGSSGTMTDSLAKSLTALGYDGLYDGSGIALVAKEGIDIGQTPMKRYSLRDASPEFKQWFGDSKVVDANGNPLVVYHATSKDFTYFDPKKLTKNTKHPTARLGFFTAADPASTDEFITTPYGIKKGIYEEGANVMPLYASIQNPVVIPSSQFVMQSIALQNMKKKDADKFIDDYIQSLKDEGHDGILIKASTTGRGLAKGNEFTSDNWVVFDSSQLKSAIGNVGSYGQRVPTAKEAKQFKLSQEKAFALQQKGDVRFSLRDTPQFKDWFGDSKIVNEDGTPKIMYHGTARDITAFQPRQANAIFVTEDPKFAESFSDMSENYMAREFANQLDENPEEKQKLLVPLIDKAIKSKDLGTDKNSRGFIKTTREDHIKAYMKMPLYRGMNTVGLGEALTKKIKEMLPSNQNIMPVYVSAQNPFDFSNPDHIRAIEAESTYALPINEIITGTWETIETPRIQELIKDAGFDGFYVKEGGKKNLAVYNPEQIKSATGNSGMYDKYNPDIRYNLRDTTDPAIRAAVDQVTTARDDRTHAERITGALKDDDTWSNFRAQALNRYNRLADYDKALVKQMGGAKLLADSSAEAAALMSDLGAGLTASALGVHDRVGGIPVYKNGVTTVTNLNGTVKGPVAIFAPLSKYGDPYIYQLYQFWAGAKRGKRLLADGREQTYTPAMMAYAQRLERQYPEFDQIQKEWIKYNNGLVQFLVDTGVLSKDKADEFTRYSDYVPFYRQFEGQQTIGPNLFASISGVKGPKKLKGGGAPLADFLETIVRNTQSSIQMGIKNVAAQRAADVATKIGEATRLNGPGSSDVTFTVLENGKLVYYQSHDELFINAIKSLNLPDLPFIGLLAAPANWLRNLVTKDPAFMLANMVRDSMSAYVTSGANFKPVVSTIANFGKSIAGTSPEYEKLLNAGLIGGYEFSQNVEQSSKTMEEAMRIKAGIKSGKDYALGVWQALEKGTTASDAATRIEVYKNTLAETGNEAEALFRAMEVMNFNRKGSSAVIRVLTAAIPFLNARMQGLDVLYRAAIRPTIKKLGGKYVTDDEIARQKTFVVRGLTIAALSCMYWALTHDDDEYKKQEQEVRDNYWLVPSLGIKIPTPFEVGILFKVIPERIMAYSFGDDTGKDFAKSMGRQLSSTLAFNPIPQTALPLVETITNYSFFTGRDIVPQGLKDVAPEFQVGPGTSLFAQWLGQGIGASPMKIDHLVKGYTGTMGGYLVDMLDMVMDLNNDSPKVSKRLEQMPFIKRFALDPEARGTVTAFYEMKDSVDEVTRTINLLERTGDYKAWGEYYQDNMNMLATKDYIQDLEKQMKELRDMKNMIRNSSLSGDQKRDAILDITKMENQLTANMQQLKKLTAK